MRRRRPTSSSSPPTRSSTGGGPTAAATRRRTVRAPRNPYGASKLAGESAAQAAFLRHGGLDRARRATVAGRRAPGRPPTRTAVGAARRRIGRPQLAIVRTAWLYGPPGNDFPARILAAADRARAAGEPLRVVGDEIGSPTFAPDLAEGILDLLAPRGRSPGSTTSSTPGSCRGPAGRVTSSPPLEVEVPIVEISLVDLDQALDAAGLVGPGAHARCRRASPFVRGRRPSPTTCRSWRASGPERRADEPRR